jgi:hypothetical protein
MMSSGVKKIERGPEGSNCNKLVKIAAKFEGQNI